MNIWCMHGVPVLVGQVCIDCLTRPSEGHKWGNVPGVGMACVCCAASMYLFDRRRCPAAPRVPCKKSDAEGER